MLCPVACRWELEITPLSTPYIVRFHLNSGFISKDETFSVNLFIRPNPKIWVVSPKIVPIVRDSGFIEIPHIYGFNENNDPYLCVFDPRGENPEWYFDKPLADNIVDWTAKWLACYEFWRAIGEWKCGGHNPNEDRDLACKIKNKIVRERQGQVGQVNKRLFNSLGQKIGTFSSFPLMVEVSKGSIPPLYFLAWKRNFPQMPDLQTILI